MAPISTALGTECRCGVTVTAVDYKQRWNSLQVQNLSSLWENIYSTCIWQHLQRCYSLEEAGYKTFIMKNISKSNMVRKFSVTIWILCIKWVTSYLLFLMLWNGFHSLKKKIKYRVFFASFLAIGIHFISLTQNNTGITVL